MATFGNIPANAELAADLVTFAPAAGIVATNTQAAIEEVKASASPIPVFGDGSDGNAVISTNTSMTRDMYYDNLTVNSGITLRTNGYRLFVKNTLTNNGIIGQPGNDGTLGGGAALAVGSFGTASGAGGSGGAGVGVAGGSITGYPTEARPGAGGAGGNSTGGGTAGGAGGTVSAPTSSWGVRAFVGALTGFSYTSASPPVPVQLRGGAGGGGGGGDNAGSNGRGGGGGGGCAIIAAKAIVNNGTITCAGGNGGATGNPAGGGGGGGGGVLVLTYGTLTGTGTETVAGGSAGGGQVAGSPGTAGTLIRTVA